MLNVIVKKNLIYLIADLKQELNVKTLPSDNRTLNTDKTLTNDDICQIESETKTTNGGAESTTNLTHPIKRKLSVALKFARRAFRSSKRGKKRNSTLN